jgi:cytochrome P450
MKEMVATKKAAVESDKNESSTIDILGQLIKGQDDKNAKLTSGVTLTDSEVMGNLFVFMMAGHETTANSIHFCLLFLALNPGTQKKVHQELDSVFQHRPIPKRDYDRDLSPLLSGMLGAVLNEQLRLVAPVVNIPKYVGAVPQKLTVQNKVVCVPAKTMIRLCVPAVHRNPAFWPHGPPKDSEASFFPPGSADNDLEEFKPERWFKTDNMKETDFTGTTHHNTEDALPGPSKLYVPPRGAYIPFSDGPRACLGRRFAQVEVMAALAVIFSQYSIELDVREWATDKEVESMSKEAKREIWRKAEAKANATWQNKMTYIITLQLSRAGVPLRLVMTGEERFGGM